MGLGDESYLSLHANSLFLTLPPLPPPAQEKKKYAPRI